MIIFRMEEPYQIPDELWARIERLVPRPSAYAIAPVAQRFAQAGSPPHRSQMRASPLSGCRPTMPKGHASTHAEQPSQSSGHRSTAPVLSSLYKASVGQLATQGGRPHRRQTCGSSRPWGSTFVMRKRAEEMPKRPSCLATQATMQARQPLHSSLRTTILLTVSPFLCAHIRGYAAHSISLAANRLLEVGLSGKHLFAEPPQVSELYRG